MNVKNFSDDTISVIKIGSEKSKACQSSITFAHSDSKINHGELSETDAKPTLMPSKEPPTIALIAALLFYFLAHSLVSYRYIFGEWTFIWSAAVCFCVYPVLNEILENRQTTPDGHLYEPNRQSNFLSMLIIAGIAIYLYPKIENPKLSTGEHIIALLWFGFIFVFQFVLITYNLIYNRNDYIRISGNILTYRDNDKHEQISLLDIKEAKLDDHNVKLEFQNGKYHIIMTKSGINISDRESRALVNTINKKLSSLKHI